MHEAVRLFGAWADAGRAVRMGLSHAPRGEQALKRMPVQRHDRVLDLGCGEGWASRQLAERAGPLGDVVGLDGSEAMLKLARSRPMQGLHYVAGDLLDLPFVEGRFDHVFSMEALYYVPIDAGLAEVARVLRPGGTVAICVDYYVEHKASLVWPQELGVPMDLRSRAEWEKALMEAGFDEVRSELLWDPNKLAHPGTLALYGRR